MWVFTKTKQNPRTKGNKKRLSSYVQIKPQVFIMYYCSDRSDQKGLTHSLELDSLSDLVQQGISSSTGSWHSVVLLHLLQLGSSSNLLQQHRLPTWTW